MSVVGGGGGGGCCCGSRVHFGPGGAGQENVNAAFLELRRLHNQVKLKRGQWWRQIQLLECWRMHTEVPLAGGGGSPTTTLTLTLNHNPEPIP